MPPFTQGLPRMNDRDVLDRLITLRDDALAYAAGYTALSDLEPQQQRSAANLLHYTSLRRHELRDLQTALIERGLTSLSMLEAHTLDTLNCVISLMSQKLGLPDQACGPRPVSARQSGLILRQRTEALFGPTPPHREVRIMVTMPSEAATQPAIISDLLRAGMDVMRINCAHDGPEQWEAMLAHLRQACRETGRSCRSQLDLAGPKLRTGELACSGRVHKIKPTRNLFGKVLQPARFWLVPEGVSVPASDDSTLCVSGNVLADTQPGDTIELMDARDARRRMRIIGAEQHARLVECPRTAYLHENAVMVFYRNDQRLGHANLSQVNQVIKPLLLHNDDRLVLTRADEPGRNGTRDDCGAQLTPSRVHCTLDAAFGVARPGQQVWLDDGRLGGRITEANDEEITLRITHTPPGGAKLRAGKGINFPDTRLPLAALTDKDLSDLKRMAAQVDMVAMSFVRSAQDVARLQETLQTLGQTDTGIVLKIENREAFENLPAILLAAMRSERVGVMIARGDLAVEVGFERLSEVQEEILWLAEAAHVPVIWATQILENLAKKGAPSRAEVTDAAMSIRAECAMLNKGPNIVATVRFLDGILQRMHGHYHKRRLMLRPLHVCALPQTADKNRTRGDLETA
ncbi:pyruvate kinase [Granulosicoccaceae sp. 1_MG-2023]|nr:pyruvate kinase [Granulosicoccaceae sp. 1_MG-2023]